MCRSLSVGIAIVIFVIAVPVDSIKYKVTFDPAKFFLPCKSEDPIQKYFDFSQLDVRAETDDTVSCKGSVKLISALTNETISIRTTAKVKSRGRWMDTPFTQFIPDFCAEYFNPKKYWYTHATKFFVGDQRLCPPPVNLELPIDLVADLVIDSPTFLSPGEYASHTIMKQGNKQLCFEMFIDLNQM